MTRYYLYFPLGVIFTYFIWQTILDNYKGTDSSLGIFNHHIVSSKIDVLKKTPSPRLIILAGSNATFGLSAETIQRELDIPCVNFGTNAGFNVDFMTHIVKPHLKSGDILLMPLEYNLYDYRPYEMSRTLVNYIFKAYPDYISNLNFFIRTKLYLSYSYADLYDLLYVNYHPNFDQQMIKLRKFNKFGDILNNEKKYQTIKYKNAVLNSSLNPILIEGLNKNNEAFNILSKFFDWCKKNKIKVYAAYPNLLHKKEYEHHPQLNKTLKLIQMFYKNNEIEIIGTFEKSKFSENYFFDSENHLNAEGVMIRTQNVISSLNKVLIFN